MAEPVDDAVTTEKVEDGRLDPRQSDLGALRCGHLDELGQHVRAPRVEEVDAFEGDDDRVGERVGVVGELSEVVAERVRACEEQAGVEAGDEQPGIGLGAACRSMLRNAWVPDSRPRTTSGVVLMYTSHPSDRATSMITRTRTPEARTASRAATAIQKSTRTTRWTRRSSATSIMPNTTASMISAASTALGRSVNSGASTSRVSTT